MERSSKCTKDPNPLASTLAQMNTKFPLTINKEMATKYKVPTEYMPSAKRGDTHKHDRIRSKKETVGWWISESEILDEVEKRIDIMRRPTRKDVNSFYEIPWSQTIIRWSCPMLKKIIYKNTKPCN